MLLAAGLIGSQLVLAQPAPTAAPTTAPAGRGGQGLGNIAGANNADYPFPYRAATPAQIADVLNRVHNYVETNSASQVVNRETNEPITDFSAVNPNAVTNGGIFNIVGYEWGVTYNGMVEAFAATGDARFKDYVDKRMTLIGNMLKLSPPPAPRGQGGQGRGDGGGARRGEGGAARGEGAGRGQGGGIGRGGGRGFGTRSLMSPGSLDDSGSMAAGLLKARAAGMGPDLRDQIDRYLKWISEGQQRFEDGTLARNRPLPNTLWLDDLYMSVPALAHMGKLTGESKYYDDACKQILQFAQRMFVKEKGLWAHGWTMSSSEPPAFHWARANGWAAMAMTELLSVLPEDHPQRGAVMQVYKAHLKGLAQVQAGDGRWHNVLDRVDSYEETSATAMFCYAYARGINRGWLDPVTYGPVALLAWNATANQVNEQGQVQEVCVATDLAFDYAFYYYRPKSALAPHGYGPVLLAGAETTKMVKEKFFRVQFQALHHIPGQAVEQ
jgi:rhamnogalacturonyl hydrolase YesR